MIQKETLVYFNCNSGAKEGKIIGIYRDKGYRNATIGSVVTVAVKKIAPHNTNGIKKGDVLLAVVVQVKALVHYSGLSIRSSKNAVVAIKASGAMIGTSVRGISSRGKMDDPRAAAVEKAIGSNVIYVQ